MRSTLSPCDSKLCRVLLNAACGAFLFLPTGAALAQNATLSDASAVEPPVETLVPKTPRSEADEDRITASAWFARARLLHQRGQKDAALRAYQRAWRYDPQATIVEAIVPLALELKRVDEAARYAVFVAQGDPDDALQVRRLALLLAEDRKWDQAVRLYERSLELQPAMKQVSDLSSAVLHQEMGRLYFLSDQFEKAAASFAHVRDALAATPTVLDQQAQEIILGDEPADTYSLWAESFLAAKRFDEALALFEKANNEQANAGRYALQRARVEAARGETTRAIQRLEEHFAAAGDILSLEPFELLAALLHKQHPDEKQARAQLIERLEELRKERPNSIALSYSLAEQRIAADQLDDAEKLLVESLAAQTTAEGYRLLASIYQRQRNAAKLVELLGQIVRKTGSLRLIDSELTSIAADPQLVSDLLQAAREQSQGDASDGSKRQRFAAGLVALKAEQWDGAEEMFNAQIAAHPATKGNVLRAWGLGLYLADQYERAIQVLTRAINEKAVDEDATTALLSLAGALELSGKTDEALATVDKALAAEPKSLAAASRKGWILYHARRYDAAAKTYRDLIAAYDVRHDSPLLRETLRDVRLALSNVLLAQDKFDDAVELLEQVLDEYPDDAGALNDLGYLWAERGMHLERSLAMTRKAVAAEPDNGAYRDSLGWALFQLQRYDEAVRELELAASTDDPGGVVLEHLGDAYAKTGKSEQALAAWQKAVVAFQNEQEAEKLKALRQKLARHQPEQQAAED